MLLQESGSHVGEVVRVTVEGSEAVTGRLTCVIGAVVSVLGCRCKQGALERAPEANSRVCSL